MNISFFALTKIINPVLKQDPLEKFSPSYFMLLPNPETEYTMIMALLMSHSTSHTSGLTEN